MITEKERRLSTILGIVTLAALLVGVFAVVRPLSATWGEVQAWIDHPYARGPVEGPVLFATQEIADGRSPFQSLDSAPFFVANYPPVYNVVCAWVKTGFGLPTLATGRSVSALAALALALLVFLMVARSAQPGNRMLPVVAGIVAGLGFMSLWPIRHYAGLMRVDMLAVFWSSAGLVVWILWPRGRVTVWISLVLFLLAAWTKPTALAGVAACLVATALMSPRLAVFRGLVWALTGIGLFGLGCALTDGALWIHLVEANRNDFELSLAGFWWRELHAVHGPWLWIGAAGWCMALVSGWRERTQDRGRTRVALAMFGVFAALGAVTVGKVGSKENYFLELMVAVSVGVGLLVAQLSWAAVVNRRMVGAGSLLVVSVLLIWPGAGFDRKRQSPAQGARALGDRVVEYLGTQPGRVLSADNLYTMQAEKGIEYVPFTVAQLAYRGVWDQSPFLDALGRRDYALLVLPFDLDHVPAAELLRFTPEMLDAMKDGYEKLHEFKGLRVYKPRSE